MPRNIYADAIQVQDACNLSGVVKSWAEAMDAIWAEARAQGKGTDYVNTHPVNVLYADKVYSLTGYGREFGAAYKTAQEKAQSEPRIPNAESILRDAIATSRR